MPTLLQQIKQRIKESKAGGAKTVAGGIADAVNVKPVTNFSETTDRTTRKKKDPKATGMFTQGLSSYEATDPNLVGVEGGTEAERKAGILCHDKRLKQWRVYYEDSDGQVSSGNLSPGITQAMPKAKKKKLDEMSPKVLTRYVVKANGDAEKAIKKGDDKRFAKRLSGITKANLKTFKEDTLLHESKEEGKETLHTKMVASALKSAGIKHSHVTDNTSKHYQGGVKHPLHGKASIISIYGMNARDRGKALELLNKTTTTHFDGYHSDGKGATVHHFRVYK